MSLEKKMTELIDKRKGKFQRLLRKRETQRKTRTIEKQKNNVDVNNLFIECS